jgi:hypothetical protein
MLCKYNGEFLSPLLLVSDALVFADDSLYNQASPVMMALLGFLSREYEALCNLCRVSPGEQVGGILCAQSLISTEYVTQYGTSYIITTYCSVLVVQPSYITVPAEIDHTIIHAGGPIAATIHTSCSKVVTTSTVLGI